MAEVDNALWYFSDKQNKKIEKATDRRISSDLGLLYGLKREDIKDDFERWLIELVNNIKS